MHKAVLGFLVIVIFFGVSWVSFQALMLSYEWMWVLITFVGIGILAALLMADIIFLDDTNPYLDDLDNNYNADDISERKYS